MSEVAIQDQITKLLGLNLEARLTILSALAESIKQSLSSTVSVTKSEAEVLPPVNIPYTTYRELKAKKFDLEELKQQQNYVPFAPGELDSMIEAVNVQESIDELLASID